MKSRAICRIFLFTIALLCTAALFVFHPAFADEEKMHADNVTLFTNTRETGVPSDAPFPYLFTPLESGLYRFYAFSDAVPVTLELFLPEEDTPLAGCSGEGTVYLEQELTQGITYILYLSVPPRLAESVSIEVMPQRYGRCIEQPIVLSSAPFSCSRTLVKAREVHFYRFTAPQSGYYVIRSESASSSMQPLDTQCHLLDSHGVTLALDDDLLFPGDPNFRIFTRLIAGQTYYIRVNAFSNNTGSYRLVISAPQSERSLPRHVSLYAQSSVLSAGEKTVLRCTANTALGDVAYSSSDPDVCTVSAEGVVTAVGPGAAQIFAFTGTLSASTDIHVRPIEAKSLSAVNPEFSMHQGENSLLRVQITPQNATQKTISWSSSDLQVASVDGEGRIFALSPGSAVITASCGSLFTQFYVTVKPPRPVYRALVMGEESYLDGRTREGTHNTTLGVSDLLSMQSLNGTGYRVRTQINSTMQDFLDGLLIAFEDATENDVSLFYINCHGSSQPENAYLELHDGTRITPDMLRRLLEPIPGTMVVILDCCQSGAFIGKSEGMSAFNALSRGDLLVITSSAAEQDSYRLRFTAEGGEEGTATVLARSLCEGAGWDLIRDRKTRLKADSNQDGQVTFSELYQYTRRRVHYYLSGSGVSQDVQATHPGSQIVLFGG